LKEFGLSVNERIKSRKDFEKIFSEGITVVSFDRKIKAIYLVEKNSEAPGIKIAVAVGKKLGKAFWRNRIKRLLKESFRLNKKILLPMCEKKNHLLKIVFSPYGLNQKNNKKITLKEINSGAIDILEKIRNIL
jgi:ribonuclease P protein component